MSVNVKKIASNKVFGTIVRKIQKRYKIKYGNDCFDV